MKSHDFMHLHFYFPDQIRRGLEPIMQLHENHSLKRAGVAGLRVRATGISWFTCPLVWLWIPGQSICSFIHLSA
ncbi:hypothetical protein EDK85_17060 [Salmonella enterica subsp. enterica serovar Emek]|nr:hypothetical protein [Salmonella enterica subsp. enterica serovar Emek]ECB6610192.1 hypothetical protein [Salmonella enterica subsp. enterica serovar Emek]